MAFIKKVLCDNNLEVNMNQKIKLWCKNKIIIECTLLEIDDIENSITIRTPLGGETRIDVNKIDCITKLI